MNQTIAHAINNYLGLSETFIYSYLTNLKRYKPIVLTTQVTNLEQFPFRPIYDCSKISRYSWWWFRDRLGYYLYLNKKEYFEHILYFKHVLIKQKAQLIHAHIGTEGVLVLPLKRALNIPLITTFYGYDISQLPREKQWRDAYRILFERGELFLVEGNHMKNALIGIGCPKEKITLQHIGVDIIKFTYRIRTAEKGEKIIILFCGRFIEKKGLLYGLEAIRQLTCKFSNIEFRIIGDGVQKTEIVDFIHTHNLQKYIVLLGYQPHWVFTEELQKAHIYLQPSVTAQNGDSEGGAPTTLLEALACGVPVVSSLHADIPEVVLDGTSGFLVPERDSDSIAERLEYLITHQEICATMGKEGRKHIELNYNISKEIVKLETVYDNLLTKQYHE